MRDKDTDSGTAHPDISRRGFIGRAGTGAVALGGAIGVGSAAAKVAGPNRKARTAGVDYDVLVIGGGFSGVTAARDSCKNGYKTVLLEARSRLGGRTYSTEFAGHHVELGGTWIHWTQPFVWSEVQRYKLEVIDTPESNVEPGDDIRVLVDGQCRRLESPEELASTFGALSRYFAKAGSIWDRPYDASFSWKAILENDPLRATDVIKALDPSPMQRTVLEAYTSGLSHCPVDQAAHVEVSRWWALPGGNMTALRDSCGRYRFKKGTISLINSMIEDGKPEFHLAKPVKSVADLGSHVVVTTVDGQRFTAAAVIVALPMNVLPSVEFVPPLDPMVIEAGRERHAGSGIKLLTKVKGHLSKTSVSLLAPPTHPLPLTATYSVGEDHTVLASFGPDPARIDYTDKAAVQKALRDFFPDAVVEEVLYHPWTADPYSKGTWCNYRPGWFGKYYEKFQQDRGRVFFGQGDHGEGWRGFIDGAIGAGAEVALRVKNRLG